MRLDGRRFSNNVEDRRGKGSAGKIAGIGGIGGLIIAALFVWLSGGNPLSVLNNSSSFATSDEIRGDYKPTPQEEEYANFAKQILAGTEDVWTSEFKSSVLLTDLPRWCCTRGQYLLPAAMRHLPSGRFYCSADETLYIDLSLF